MKRFGTFIFLLTIATAVAGADSPVLPKEIRASLDKSHPKWEPLSILTPETQARLPERTARDRSFLWGDFNNDGQRDYVVGVVWPDTEGLMQTQLLFLGRPGGYDVRELILTQAPYLQARLTLMPKGYRFTENTVGQPRTCPYECLKMAPRELHTVYLFENGNLSMIYTAD